jgi:hypothetical protein
MCHFLGQVKRRKQRGKINLKGNYPKTGHTEINQRFSKRIVSSHLSINFPTFNKTKDICDNYETKTSMISMKNVDNVP